MYCPCLLKVSSRLAPGLNFRCVVRGPELNSSTLISSSYWLPLMAVGFLKQVTFQLNSFLFKRNAIELALKICAIDSALSE